MSDGQEFLSKSELTRSHVDALVTVATAVLVLSVTFLQNANISSPNHKNLLRWSWVLFTVSIIAGIIHSYVLILLVNEKSCWTTNSCFHRKILFLFNLLLHISFFAAAALFLIFAIINT